MTAQDLIDFLSEFPPDTQVVIEKNPDDDDLAFSSVTFVEGDRLRHTRDGSAADIVDLLDEGQNVDFLLETGEIEPVIVLWP